MRWNIESDYLDFLDDKSLIYLIAPYITSVGLDQILERLNSNMQFSVVTLWDHASLSHKVSDPNIYQILSDHDIPLYINESLHLKLYVWKNGAFLTSSNITRAGLGLSTNSNIEAGEIINLQLHDWLQINSMLRNSIRVDDEIYKNACKVYGQLNSKIENKFILPKNENKNSIADLPLSTDPMSICDKLLSQTELNPSEIHDITLLRINHLELNYDEFRKSIKDYVVNNHFIQLFVDQLRIEKSMSFGKVKAWIQENTTDTPLPFRKDLNQTTNALFDWLELVYEKQIYTKHPNYSEVIFIKD